MDRDIRILKDGYLLAEIKFRYDNNPQSGKVFVNLYSSYPLDDEEGTRSVYPSYKYDTYVHHNTFRTIDEMKEFDRSFAKSQSPISIDLNGKIEFVYEVVHYRYIVIGGNRHPIVGMVDIEANFVENKKEVFFKSATTIRDDYQISTDSAEGNVAAIKRLCALEWMNLFCSDVNEVDVRYA